MTLFWKRAILLSPVVLLSACGGDPKTSKAASLPPPAVSVIEVQPEDVPIYSEYAAQTYARDLVEVRGRVDGYIEKRLFQAGSDVPAGHDLFILDLLPSQSTLPTAT